MDCTPYSSPVRSPMVFEVDRMRVVTAVDVAINEFPSTRRRSIEACRDRPALLGARTARPADEHNDALITGSTGIRPVDPARRSGSPYESQKAQAWRTLATDLALVDHYPATTAEVDEAATRAPWTSAEPRYLPLVSRQVQLGRCARYPTRGTSSVSARGRLLLKPDRARGATAQAPCMPVHLSALATAACAASRLLRP